MCGIFGILNHQLKPNVQVSLKIEKQIRTVLKHRGPDACATWCSNKKEFFCLHTRLKIIDLISGDQPMTIHGKTIVFNGEIYNYKELRDALCAFWRFETKSDTEVILAAYEQWGSDCVSKFRGMFAFAIWDDKKKTLFCARDQFGIKPFYYIKNKSEIIFASEIKALLPFLDKIEVNPDALKEYLTFQFYLNTKTLFKNVFELSPAHFLIFRKGVERISRYWEISYQPNFGKREAYFKERLADLMDESISLNLRSDVPVGAYLSGGFDSSLVATLAARKLGSPLQAYHGKFNEGPNFNESLYAREVAEHAGMRLAETTISPQDFMQNIHKVIWHLDQPVAGPGSLPQFCVSRLAASRGKVVLGGQGGDEIFGGYVRYLVAYFEQCIRGAIRGTLNKNNHVVTYESIIPNLKVLQGYEPMLQEFWREGLFDDMDRRYFRLINRNSSVTDEVRWSELGSYEPFEAFKEIFNGNNIGQESYFDKMTHFDFKTLLPALLHVEDRMSMAHGLESRVPFLDVPLIEHLATVPAHIKFKGGCLKRLPLLTFGNLLPKKVTMRSDKMGFPVPLQKWLKGPLRDFVQDTFRSSKAMQRQFYDSKKIIQSIEKEKMFNRKIWGLLNLEIWHQLFVDRQGMYKE